MKILLTILLGIALTSCMSDQEYGSKIAQNPDSETIRCIQGHKYIILNYHAPYLGYMSMAPLFNDDGIPVKCNKVIK